MSQMDEEAVALTSRKDNQDASNTMAIKQNQSAPVPKMHHPAQKAYAASAPASYHSQTLLLLMDLPMKAYLGIGGSTKLMLMRSLKAVNNELKQMEDDNEESAEMNTGTNGYQSLPITPKFSNREQAESTKYDIEQALNQGYTLNLIIAVIQGLFGAFLYGWNVSILNVPQNVVQNEVTQMNNTQYAALQSMFCGGGLIGALCAGPLQDRIGRKKSMLVIDFIFIISMVITYLYTLNGLFLI